MCSLRTTALRPARPSLRKPGDRRSLVPAIRSLTNGNEHKAFVRLRVRSQSLASRSNACGVGAFNRGRSMCSLRTTALRPARPSLRKPGDRRSLVPAIRSLTHGNEHKSFVRLRVRSQSLASRSDACGVGAFNRGRSMCSLRTTALRPARPSLRKPGDRRSLVPAIRSLINANDCKSLVRPRVALAKPRLPGVTCVVSVA